MSCRAAGKQLYLLVFEHLVGVDRVVFAKSLALGLIGDHEVITDIMFLF